MQKVFRRGCAITATRSQNEERPSTEDERLIELTALSLALEHVHIRPRDFFRDGMAVWDKESDSTHELNDQIWDGLLLCVIRHVRYTA